MSLHQPTISRHPSINKYEQGPHSFDAFIGIVGTLAVVVVVGGGSVMLWMHQSRILVA